MAVSAFCRYGGSGSARRSHAFAVCQQCRRFERQTIRTYEIFRIRVLFSETAPGKAGNRVGRASWKKLHESVRSLPGGCPWRTRNSSMIDWAAGVSPFKQRDRCKKSIYNPYPTANEKPRWSARFFIDQVQTRERPRSKAVTRAASVIKPHISLTSERDVRVCYSGNHGRRAQGRSAKHEGHREDSSHGVALCP